MEEFGGEERKGENFGGNLVARRDRIEGKLRSSIVINRSDLNRTRVAEGKGVTDMERGERRQGRRKVGAKGDFIRAIATKGRTERKERRKEAMAVKKREKKNPQSTDLILGAEQLQLFVDQAVLGTLLFSQCSLLLELGTPEGLDAMHRAAELLVRQLELLLEVPELSLEIVVLMLEFTDIATAVAQHVRIRALSGRSRPVNLILQVESTVAATFTGIAYRHELAIVIEDTRGCTIEAGVPRRHARRAGHGGSRGASGSVMSAPTAPG